MRGKGRGDLESQLGDSWKLEESKGKEMEDVGRVRESMMGERLRAENEILGKDREVWNIEGYLHIQNCV